MKAMSGPASASTVQEAAERSDGRDRQKVIKCSCVHTDKLAQAGYSWRNIQFLILELFMAGLVYPGLPWAVFKGTDAVTLLSTIKTTLLGLQATATAASQDAVINYQ